jgi:hypothetical protein
LINKTKGSFLPTAEMNINDFAVVKKPQSCRGPQPFHPPPPKKISYPTPILSKAMIINTYLEYEFLKLEPLFAIITTTGVEMS